MPSEQAGFLFGTTANGIGHGTFVCRVDRATG